MVLSQGECHKKICHRWRHVFARELCRTYLFQLTYKVSAMFAEVMCGG